MTRIKNVKNVFYIYVLSMYVTFILNVFYLLDNGVQLGIRRLSDLYSKQSW